MKKITTVILKPINLQMQSRPVEPKIKGLKSVDKADNIYSGQLHNDKVKEIMVGQVNK